MTSGAALVILIVLVSTSHGYNVVRRDPFASLSDTLVTKQNAACDGDILVLECPPRTKISIQLVLYHRTTPSSALCPPTSKQPRIYTAGEGLTCNIKEALRTVEELCQGKQSCSILTSPASFGVSHLDNCPGIRKYIEVVYKCHPTSFSSRLICGGDKMELSCSDPTESVAILGGQFKHAGSVPIYCPIRSEYLETAARGSVDNSEQAAVTIKECERSNVTPALITQCHGSQSCDVEAQPNILSAPKCYMQHVALKIAFACMNKENFLPTFVTIENKESEPLTTTPSPKIQFIHSTMNPQLHKSGEDFIHEDSINSQDHDTFMKPSSNAEYEIPVLLKIIYFLAGPYDAVSKALQSDVWKLVLVLTVSLGLGLSCFLILIIIKLCRLYRHKVTQPLPKTLSSHINLDSDGVDFDNINSNLYTPLPEPKIMQISSPDDTSTYEHPAAPPFTFSTLTRSRTKAQHSSKGPNIENYLGDSTRDNVVRYSTIGRGSRAANFMRNDFEGEMEEPRSLNTSYENNHLYY